MVALGGGGLGGDDFDFDFGVAVAVCGADCVAGGQFGVDHEFGEFVFKIFLNCAFERACSELWVVAFFGDEVAGFGCDFERVAEGVDAFVESCEFDVDDFEYCFFGEGVEHDDVVDSVEEFGGKGFVEGFAKYALAVCFVVGLV